MTPQLRLCWGKDLDAATLYELLRLRVEVFVIEQRCPYPELDGRDLVTGTRHFWLEQDGEVISTLRLMEEAGAGESGFGTTFRIGRVCTRADARGNGHTARLMRAALADVGERPCHLNAQSHLAGMYAGHGFAVVGEEFLEDGIPHVPMSRVPR